ncbi:MAG TPA: hypothetical protein VFV34_26075 [Blastocatellia bacterium]|nr:hypothetical protein [Blastocatellia bacterium]
MAFRYRESVLVELARHGVQPTNDTPPEFVRDFINDLYRYEIRVLRDKLMSGKFPKSDYARRVAELRARYPVLGLPLEFWAAPDE